MSSLPLHPDRIPIGHDPLVLIAQGTVGSGLGPSRGAAAPRSAYAMGAGRASATVRGRAPARVVRVPCTSRSTHGPVAARTPCRGARGHLAVVLLLAIATGIRRSLPSRASSARRPVVWLSLRSLPVVVARSRRAPPRCPDAPVAAAPAGPSFSVDGAASAETSPTGRCGVVAVPLLGIDALIAAGALLGERFALVRMVGAVVLTALVGLAFSPKMAPTSDEGRAPPSPAWRVGLIEFVGHHAPWWLVGLTVASLVEPLLPPDWLPGGPVAAQLVAATVCWG